MLLIIALAFRPSENGLCDSPVVGDHSGAPGETSCTGCHGGTANTGSGTLDFNLGTATYVPGQIYNATVTISQESLDKFGFVATALKNSNNTTIGTFALNETINTRLFSSGGRDYIAHTPCGADATIPGTINWTFTWQAPATDVGNITIYLSSLAANHNHNTTGDDTYTTSLVLTPDLTGITEQQSSPEIIIYPNPFSGNLVLVQFINSHIDVAKYSIFNLAGQNIVIGNAPIENSSMKIDASTLGVGIYFLKVSAGNQTVILKMIKQ